MKQTPTSFCPVADNLVGVALVAEKRTVDRPRVLPHLSVRHQARVPYLLAKHAAGPLGGTGVGAVGEKRRAKDVKEVVVAFRDARDVFDEGDGGVAIVGRWIGEVGPVVAKNAVAGGEIQIGTRCWRKKEM